MREWAKLATQPKRAKVYKLGSLPDGAEQSSVVFSGYWFRLLACLLLHAVEPAGARNHRVGWGARPQQKNVWGR